MKIAKKNASRVPALLESCGVDCGDAAFDGDAFDLDGFGENCALQAVRQDFEDVAYFGRASRVAQNMHGLRVDLIHTHADGEAFGLFRGGFFGRRRGSFLSGGLFGGVFLHR